MEDFRCVWLRWASSVCHTDTQDRYTGTQPHGSPSPVSSLPRPAGRDVGSNNMTERAPLLNYCLSTSCNEYAGQQQQSPAAGTTAQRTASPRRGPSSTRRQPKKLNTFFGVVVPTLLSMFSVVVFLRIGKEWCCGRVVLFWWIIINKHYAYCQLTILTVMCNTSSQY